MGGAPDAPPSGSASDVALSLEIVGGEQISFRQKMPFNSKQAFADCRILHNENMLSAESNKITYKLYGLLHEKVRKKYS